MTRRPRKKKGQRTPKTEAEMRKAKHDELTAQATKVGVASFVPTPERTGRGELHVEPASVHAFDHERPGAKAPREVVVGHRVRDRMADAKVRLRRFSNLSAEQIAAGVILEQEWEASGMEPRLSANLSGTPGGGGAYAPVVMDARTKVINAIAALRQGGPEVLRIIEAVVIQGATSTAAGSARYADPEKGRVHTSAMLNVGLNLLIAHYHERAKRKPRLLTGAPHRA